MDLDSEINKMIDAKIKANNPDELFNRIRILEKFMGGLAHAILEWMKDKPEYRGKLEEWANEVKKQ